MTDDKDPQQTLLLPGLLQEDMPEDSRRMLSQALTELPLADPEQRLGEFLHRLENPPKPLPALVAAGALLARRLGLGYSHLALREAVEDDRVLRSLVGSARQWEKLLAGLRITGTQASARETPTPLVLDPAGRLYLYKYWRGERYAETEIQRRGGLSLDLPNLDPAATNQAFAEIFPDDDPIPRLGAVLALTRGFSLIAGGPGTGKTTLIIRLLRLLESAAPEVLRHTVVTAPTGKAAMRLQESFGKSAPPGVEPVTLHRLLKANRHGEFRHNARNPLTARLVIVDEASMIDLLLFNSLLQALPPDSHLVLVGDENQLAAVEAGAVFPELAIHSRAGHCDDPVCHDFQRLTGSAFPPDLLPRASENETVCGIRLTKIHRFSKAGGIQQLSGLVMEGKTEQAWDLLQNSRDYPDVTFAPLGSEGIPLDPLTSVVEKQYAPLLKLTDPARMLEQLSAFRILTGLRRGRDGSDFFNELIEARLRRLAGQTGEGAWFPGRAIMITRNDYQLGLSNGDTGVTALDCEGRLRVFFPQSDSPEPRPLPPARLPAHAPAWALTIHKSQGSEFNRVLLLLPGQGSPLLSRELLYTAITRAREHVEIWTNQTVFTQALHRREARGRSALFS